MILRVTERACGHVVVTDALTTILDPLNCHKLDGHCRLPVRKLLRRSSAAAQTVGVELVQIDILTN